MGMGWNIECGYPQCLQPSRASNIAELVGNFCDDDGLLVCPHCKKPSGYIRKKFNLQEEGKTWEPILRGVIKLGDVGDTYQPFVFIASYEAEEGKEDKLEPSIIDLPITDLWFSYYKDLRDYQRADGSLGRLKMGYGPGGPPVIGVPQLLELLRHLLKLKMTTNSDVAALLTGRT
jgi:hypothetical protein